MPRWLNHRVVVKVLLQPFPQLEREFVERLVAIQQIVGADDRGVATHVAAADPAFFEHSNRAFARILWRDNRPSPDRARRRR